MSCDQLTEILKKVGGIMECNYTTQICHFLPQNIECNMTNTHLEETVLVLSYIFIYLFAIVVTIVIFKPIS